MYSHMLSAVITALTCWLGAFMEADAAKECRSIQTAEPSKGLMGPFFPCLMWPKHRICLVNLVFESGLLKVSLLRNAEFWSFEFPNLAGFFKFNKETFYFDGISTHLLFKQASSDFFLDLVEINCDEFELDCRMCFGWRRFLGLDRFSSVKQFVLTILAH